MVWSPYEKQCIGVGFGHLPCHWSQGLEVGRARSRLNISSFIFSPTSPHRFGYILGPPLSCWPLPYRWRRGTCRKPRSPVQLGDLLGQLPCVKMLLAGVAWDRRVTATRVPPIRSSSRISSTKLQFAASRPPVLLAEVGDRSIAGLQVPQQQISSIAAGFPFQPARRPDPVDVAVKVELQQVGWIVGRLSGAHAALNAETCDLTRSRAFTKLSIARTGLSGST